jgi:hypothetical protein
MSKAPSVHCKAISTNSGKQCKRNAIPDGTVCRYHGGGAQHVKVKAAVQAELLGWGLGDSTADPGRCYFGSSPRALLEQRATPCCSRRRTRRPNV